MRIFITGGAGFIGSHLARALLGQGHAVDILDDLSTGSRENFADLKGAAGFSFTEGSVDDAAAVSRGAAKADCIYHLAAAVGVRLIIDKPVRSIETNVHGAATVLREAAGRRTPVFIASSSEVYGKSRDVPFREDGDVTLGAPANLRWSYACSKLVDECLALAHHREAGLPVVVGRLFNTAGPGQTGRYGMVLPNFVRQAVEGRPLTVYGDGTQTRCFCHVADTVTAMIGLMQDPGCYGETFNIGTTREIAILDLARLVRDIAGSQSAIELVPYEEAYASGFEDMVRRVPDTAKIERQIGWRPEISLEELVRDAVDGAANGRSGRVTASDITQDTA